LKKRIVVNIEDRSDRDYWADRMELDKNREPLEVRETPCEDCAVVLGMYAEFSEDLAKRDAPTRKFCSERWFCHNNVNKACRGNWNLVMGPLP